jgi:type II secretion system protein J
MTRPGLPRPADSRGLTLLEVLLAFAILAVIVVVLVASLRVGARAWEAGERRAAAQQEKRAVIELLTEALASAAPYRGRLGGGLDRVVLFEGDREEVHFVTTAPPLVLDAPAAPYHAVTLRHTRDTELRLTERLVPAEEPFGDTPHVVLSRSVREFRLEYRDDQGAWQPRWDARSNNALPTAVRVELTLREPGHGGEKAVTFVVPIALGKGAA